MKRTLYNVRGEPVAYISDYVRKTIYLWDGHPVAYLYAFHVYGFNGSHLGWFVHDVVYDSSGNRIGFTSETCPHRYTKKWERERSTPYISMRHGTNLLRSPNSVSVIQRRILRNS